MQQVNQAMTAMAMGLHPELNTNSPVALVDSLVLQMIKRHLIDQEIYHVYQQWSHKSNPNLIDEHISLMRLIYFEQSTPKRLYMWKSYVTGQIRPLHRISCHHRYCHYIWFHVPSDDDILCCPKCQSDDITSFSVDTSCLLPWEDVG